MHDWDATEVPILADLTIGGQPRKVVMFANRNGFYYTLDRTNGKIIVAKPFVTTTWAKEIGADGRPVFCPGHTPDEKGEITCPDITGGTNFWPPTFDPSTRTFFVNAREACMTYYAWKPEYKPGERFTGGAGQRVPSADMPVYGALRAIDPATGRAEVGVPVPATLDFGAADDGVRPDLQRRQRGQPAGARLAQRQAALAIPDGREPARNVPDHVHGRRPPARARAGGNDADGVGTAAVARMNRRSFLSSSSAAGLLAAWGANCGSAASQQGATVTTAPIQGDRILLKGGCVLSLDPQVGDFDTADVLIEGSRIAAVGPNLSATATIVDASNTIVMPGFIDTHRHMWQGALRNILPNGLLSDYVRDILGVRAVYAARGRPHRRPRHGARRYQRRGDDRARLVAHRQQPRAHGCRYRRSARVGRSRGVRIRGRRAGAANQYPQDIRRLRKQHFASADQLLTLALAGGMDAKEWMVARDVSAPISVHAGGSLAGLEKALGPDVTYIHCTTFTDAAWKLVADSGGHISIACPIEMEMGHGVPPIQQSLDHGLRPSLSVDVETEMPGDFFTQMRSVFTLQRMLALNQPRPAARPQPQLLTARDVVEFATVAGARANHLERKIGTLTPGKDADVIVLRTDTINVMPFNNAYGAVVLAMDTSNVDTVFIAGKAVKQGGRLIGVDLDRIRRDAEQSRDFIVGKAGWKKSRV